MDAFSSLIDHLPFVGITYGNFKISHLLYADDLLVFGKASLNNYRHLKKIINCFSNASGLHMNLDKSSLMLPKHFVNVDMICWALSLAPKDITTYLGIPISFKRLKISDFSPLMEEITKNLSGWNANLLSLAGRLQYLKFTMLNSIAYWIRGAILPKAVMIFFKKVASMFFFFGDITATNKLHLVAWDTVYKPKDKGDTKATKMWKSICLTAQSTKANWILNITPTSQFSFVWDYWCNNNRIVELHPNGLNFGKHVVSNFIADGVWQFPPGMPTDLVNLIVNVSITDNQAPCLIWNGNPKAKFSDFVKEFYQTLPLCAWSGYVWHKRHILRYSVFTWLTIVGGLKTAWELNKRNIGVDLKCSFCQSYPESSAHLFFDCSFTHSIITSLVPECNVILLRPNLLQLFDWVTDYPNFSSHTKRIYVLTICCTIYYVWRERNDRRFALANSSTNSICLRIKQAIHAKTVNWRDR
ncbi:Putative ribonuclease H protein [Dendrobium catenatum]|uniref:Ribonuclease H protein n=1 Tax=Dendrobium catenatum TaxID=906689 RepID=A0A2I0WCR3_9ASPA|nr:Putative ribonuclease H protein [Dendrobium catenatum]